MWHREFVIPREALRFAWESSCAVEGPAVMKQHCYFVYIVASKSRVLYIGMTNDLERRVWEHKHDLVEGFSNQYRCHRLLRNQLGRSG